MADIVNLIDVEPGQKVGLYGGATAEVVSNPRDGVWLFVRYLTSPEDPDQVGEEDMVFAQDVLELVSD
jgi:ABC-type glycerol-3-phosphate transport system substrate-binding protein